jgi:hypothetical protein
LEEIKIINRQLYKPGSTSSSSSDVSAKTKITQIDVGLASATDKHLQQTNFAAQSAQPHVIVWLASEAALQSLRRATVSFVAQFKFIPVANDLGSAPQREKPESQHSKLTLNDQLHESSFSTACVYVSMASMP